MSSFNKKREEELMKQFEKMENEYHSINLKEGQATKQGGVICPHCGYEMPMLEYLSQFQSGAVRILTCTKCKGEFKSR